MKNLILFGILLASSCLAQDKQPYCEYVKEQAAANSDILAGPIVSAGISPGTGIKPQLVFGVTESLAGVRKADEWTKIGKAECEQYGANENIQLRIQYDAQELEKEALQNHIRLTNAANERLVDLYTKSERLAANENLTRQTVYQIEKAKAQLELDRAQTLQAIAVLTIPDLDPEPIKILIADSNEADVHLQAEQNKLTLMQNFDVSLTGGIARPLIPTPNQTYYGYGGVTVTYNLFGHRAAKHLENSLDAYGELQTVRKTDVQYQADMLRHTLEQELAAQRDALQTYRPQLTTIQTNLNAIAKVDTVGALTFRNQLTADKIILEVQIKDAEFRVNQIQDYLERNF